MDAEGQEIETAGVKVKVKVPVESIENILVGIGQNYMDAVRLQTHTNGVTLFCTSSTLDHNLVIS